MGLIETNGDTLSGNSIIVGDLIFTWEEEDQLELKPCHELSDGPSSVEHK